MTDRAIAVLPLLSTFDGSEIMEVAKGGRSYSANAAALVDAQAALIGALAGIIGNTASYLKSAVGAQSLLAASTVKRVVLILIHVDTVFANGDGAQPTFSVGETGNATKFSATALLTGAAAGATFVLGGVLDANDALLVTAVAGTGTTETGAITVTAIAVPSA